MEHQAIELGAPGGVLSGYACEAGDQELLDYLDELGSDGEAIVGLLNKQCPIVAVIQRIFVDEPMRRRGLGSRLMTHFFEKAENLGAAAIIINAPDSDHGSEGVELAAWLESYGFAPASRVNDGAIYIFPAAVASAVEDEV
ncbi:GNAT family N-acetyltransferase [Pseudomonas sp. GOM6]|uniref:GNAT family N-acetyltransferase n=1 Tax=Pseudomonas sp. GOM6 TaxID=3036944 RepID=UPI00240901B5|nr:GNAT family N-acetyltransferase [Pseudomonas sp. GOM6]MDG1581075.1 GNAT family N-acetyltransferase [Pseudomonas sp. GOM6]